MAYPEISDSRERRLGKTGLERGRERERERERRYLIYFWEKR